MSSPKYDSIRDAVAVDTLWSESADHKQAIAYISSLLRERGEEGLFDLVHGLVSLAGWATIEAAAATGTSEALVLQDIAAKIARDTDG